MSLVRLKALMLVFIFGFIFLSPGMASASGFEVVFQVNSETLNINGASFQMDAAPFVQNGRVYVPVRYLASALNIPDSGITWNPVTAEVCLTNRQILLQMNVGSCTENINGKAQDMDVAPLLVNPGRVMLPARYVAEAFGYTVSWDQASEEVIISGGGSQNQTAQSGTGSASPNTVILPALVNSPGVQATVENYSWTYHNVLYQWSVAIPSSLLQCDSNLGNTLDNWYNLDGADQASAYPKLPLTLQDIIQANGSEGDFVAYVTEPQNYQFVDSLTGDMAKEASAAGFDRQEELDWVARFVQSLPYQLTEVPYFPAATLVYGGDCKDKSILLSAILKQLGYQVALINFPAEEFSSDIGHEAVGVAMPGLTAGGGLSYYNDNGTDYYYMETTAPGWLIGELPNGENSTGVDLADKNANVYPVP